MPGMHACRDGPNPAPWRPWRGFCPSCGPIAGGSWRGFVALLCSSTATLVLPFFAARPDRPWLFTPGRPARSAIISWPLSRSAAVLGVSSATRFYFVTWLGERVTADIRKAVFDNVLGLTPAFFEITRTGEVLSRLTADTTLVQTVIGSSASVALRNLVTLTGGLAADVLHQPEADAAGAGRGDLVIMLPLILFGRWVRTLSPHQPGPHRRYQRPGQRNARTRCRRCRPSPAKARSAVAFGGTVESSFDAAIIRTRARAVMTAVVIFAFFTALASVLYVGAQDVHRPSHDRRTAGAVHFLGVLGGGRRRFAVGSLGRSAARRRRFRTADGIAP